MMAGGCRAGVSSSSSEALATGGGVCWVGRTSRGAGGVECGSNVVGVRGGKRPAGSAGVCLKTLRTAARFVRPLGGTTCGSREKLRALACGTEVPRLSARTLHRTSKRLAWWVTLYSSEEQRKKRGSSVQLLPPGGQIWFSGRHILRASRIFPYSRRRKGKPTIRIELSE